MNDGTTEYFVLAENLEITFAGELMRVFSTSYSLEFNRVDVKDFHFSDVPTSIAGVHASGNTAVEGNMLIVSGVPEKTAITIYDTSGVVVRQSVAVAGNCTISLDNLVSGLYIVTYNNQTIKFLKR